MCPVDPRGKSVGKSADYMPAVVQEALTGDNSQTPWSQENLLSYEG